MTDNTTAEPEYLTVVEVAQDLRISKMTVYRMIKDGELFAIQLKRSLRILAEPYREYKRQLHAAALARADKAGTPAPIPGQTTIPAGAPF